MTTMRVTAAGRLVWVQQQSSIGVHKQLCLT